MRVCPLLWLAAVALSVSAHGQENQPPRLEYQQPDCSAGPPFKARLSWDLPNTSGQQVEIRLGAADGRVFKTVTAQGSTMTGQWVRPGSRFVFVAQETGEVLHDLEAGIPAACDVSDEPIEPDQINFETEPPRLRYCGKPVKRTAVTVEWDVSALGEQPVHILLDSPDGRVFAQGGPVGKAETGNWVSDGKRFLLYLPMRDQVVAAYEFRILTCSISSDPEEPPLRILNR